MDSLSIFHLPMVVTFHSLCRICTSSYNPILQSRKQAENLSESVMFNRSLGLTTQPQPALSLAHVGMRARAHSTADFPTAWHPYPLHPNQLSFWSQEISLNLRNESARVYTHTPHLHSRKHTSVSLQVLKITLCMNCTAGYKQLHAVTPASLLKCF